MKIEQYDDKTHADDVENLEIGDHGYKYRIINGLVLPPYVTPDRYAASRKVKTRSNDVCYISYPKSGSTWLSNVLYLILNNGETPKDKTLRSCLHWMESSWTYPRSLEEVDALPSPRIFKSHMPYHMALGGDPVKNPCKYIYIARNPKDVCVSYFHFESDKAWSGDYNGPWEHWLEQFLAGKIQRGDWFNHVLSWWKHRDEENILFLKYEDMKQDFSREFHKITSFLGYDLDVEVIDKIYKETSFVHMKTAQFSNHQEITQLEGFFRKGKIGSWKERFTVAQSEAFDQICRQKFQGTGLEFDFQ